MVCIEKAPLTTPFHFVIIFLLLMLKKADITSRTTAVHKRLHSLFTRSSQAVSKGNSVYKQPQM